MCTSVSSEEQCPRPLSLQDLCLVVVINDLDGYPEELLASLPRWLRYHLLNNLPALDLCRLDHASVAKGVDTEEIWNSKVKLPRLPFSRYRDHGCRMPPFTNSTASDFYQYTVLRFHDSEGLVTAPSTRQHDTPQPKEKYLCNALSNMFEYGVRTAIDLLITLRGDLSQKLISSNDDHQSSPADSTINHKHNHHQVPIHHLNRHPTSVSTRKTQDTGQRLTQKKTALATHQFISVQLAPHRLLPIYMGCISDHLELFSLIVHSCALQPTTLHLNLSPTKPWIRLLQNEKFGNVLKHFLDKTVALELRLKRTEADGIHNDVIMVLQRVLEAVFKSSGGCRLKSLHCPLGPVKYLSPYLFTLPSSPASVSYQGLSTLELGIVKEHSFPHLTALLEQQPRLEHICLKLSNVSTVKASAVKLFSALASLLSKPQFKVLWLILHKISTEYALLLLELMWQFMTAPCPHGMELRLFINNLFKFDHGIEPMPSLDTSVSTHTVPECGLHHKTLVPDYMEFIADLLLLMPTIRLKNIEFDCKDMEYRYLHRSALHSDLQVAKLTLSFHHQPHGCTFLSTLKEDLTTLFQKPTLEEISITGDWGKCEEIRCAVEVAFRHRAQFGPLKRITISNGDSEEIKEIWDAIFSLPQLDKMELAIGDDLGEQILQNEHLLYESWKQFGSQQQVKLLQFIQYTQEERTLKVLNNLAKNISFIDSRCFLDDTIIATYCYFED